MLWVLMIDLCEDGGFAVLGQYFLVEGIVVGMEWRLEEMQLYVLYFDVLQEWFHHNYIYIDMNDDKTIY